MTVQRRTALQSSNTLVGQNGTGYFFACLPKILKATYLTDLNEIPTPMSTRNPEDLFIASEQLCSTMENPQADVSLPFTNEYDRIVIYDGSMDNLDVSSECSYPNTSESYLPQSGYSELAGALTMVNSVEPRGRVHQQDDDVFDNLNSSTTALQDNTIRRTPLTHKTLGHTSVTSPSFALVPYDPSIHFSSFSTLFTALNPL